MTTCSICQGAILEPDKAYGYVGKVCWGHNPSGPQYPGQFTGAQQQPSTLETKLDQILNLLHRLVLKSETPKGSEHKE